MLAVCCILPSACTTPRPNNVDNVCLIFKQYPKWYWATQDAEKKWGIPINVQMAIMHQESHFNAKAKPPRRYILWVIPWFRPTSAYGYSQALDGTWARYKNEIGTRWSLRDDFTNAADFIGWYTYKIRKQLKLSRYNAAGIYTAYHEGIGGYRRGTHHKKKWLLAIANKVQRRANAYAKQLKACQKRLPTKPWWRKIF